MTAPELAIDTASIVIKGTFEPDKFPPQELVTQGLVEAKSLTEASQRFSTNEISILETATIRLAIGRDTIQMTAQLAEAFEPMRDLAVGILRLSSSTKMSVLGMNREVHFATSNVASWHAVGDTIVPKDLWSGVLDVAGMASVTLKAARGDINGGYRQITVQPSALVPQGVFVSHNDHYTLEDMSSPVATREQLDAETLRQPQVSSEKVNKAIVILSGEWENSMKRSSAVIERVAQMGT
jgi:hypothetical protein